MNVTGFSDGARDSGWVGGVEIGASLSGDLHPELSRGSVTDSMSQMGMFCGSQEEFCVPLRQQNSLNCGTGQPLTGLPFYRGGTI